MLRQRYPHLRQAMPSPVTAIAMIGQLEAEYQATAHSRPMAPVNQTNLTLTNWQAFHLMTTDSGSNGHHWGIVASSLNIAMILAEQGIGVEYLPLFNRALAAAARSFVRGQSTGTWRYDGDGIGLIQSALIAHDLQIPHATQSEISAALAEVHRRADAGEALNVSH